MLSEEAVLVSPAPAPDPIAIEPLIFVHEEAALVPIAILSWQWVGFGLRLGWVHTLRYISYASLYDRFLFLTLSFVSLCSTLTGILALTVMQRHPSNIIDFGLLMLH